MSMNRARRQGITSVVSAGKSSKASVKGIMLLSVAAVLACYLTDSSLTLRAVASILGAALLLGGLVVLMGDKHLRWTLVLPSTLVMFAVTIIPLLYLLGMSFTDVKLLNFRKPWNFIGLKNYQYFFTRDPLFFPALIRTFEYTAFALLIQLVLGVALALLLQRTFNGRNLVSSFLVIPVMTCPIVIAMLWKSMMNSQTGVLNGILQSAGMSGLNWLTNEPLKFIQSIPYIGETLVKQYNANIGFLSLLMVNTWQWTPFVFLMVLAGLNSLPREPFEAAVVDGASGWQTFRHITLPLLRPVLSVVILMRLIDLMKVYDQIYAMFGDNITMRTLNIHIFFVGLTNQDYGRGSALSVIVLVFIVLMAQMFLGMNARLGRDRGGI